MPKLNVEYRHKETIDSLLLKIPNVVEGKMFGYPAYYVNGKLFACIYGEGVGVKVPEDVAIKLLSEQHIQHIVPFQPLGKPKMKEWIQILHMKSEDYLKDMDIFLISVKFVSQLPPGKKKGHQL